MIMISENLQWLYPANGMTGDGGIRLVQGAHTNNWKNSKIDKQKSHEDKDLVYQTLTTHHGSHKSLHAELEWNRSLQIRWIHPNYSILTCPLHYHVRSCKIRLRLPAMLVMIDVPLDYQQERKHTNYKKIDCKQEKIRKNEQPNGNPKQQ